MPSRLLREGILTSERVDKLDAAGEVFYRRLMSKVDDHGLFDARLSVLRSFLYPLRVDTVSEQDIREWLDACADAGLIALYSNDGKPFLQMIDTKWAARSEPKCPLPTDPGSVPYSAPANTCEQPQTTGLLFVDVVVVEDVVCAPPNGDALFDEFWKAYPKKRAKDDARKAFVKRKPSRALLDSMLAALCGQAQSVDWTKDGGQFIPYPATWLNDARWQDVEQVTISATATDNPQYAEHMARLAADRARATAASPEHLAQMAATRRRVAESRLAAKPTAPTQPEESDA